MTRNAIHHKHYRSAELRMERRMPARKEEKKRNSTQKTRRKSRGEFLEKIDDGNGRNLENL